VPPTSLQHLDQRRWPYDGDRGLGSRTRHASSLCLLGNGKAARLSGHNGAARRSNLPRRPWLGTAKEQTPPASPATARGPPSLPRRSSPPRSSSNTLRTAMADRLRAPRNRIPEHQAVSSPVAPPSPSPSRR
jgi:hypothetical protein